MQQTGWRPFPKSSSRGEKVSLGEWIKELYLDLLESDWKFNDIDEMDIYYYLELLSFKENKESRKNIENALSIL